MSQVIGFLGVVLLLGSVLLVPALLVRALYLAIRRRWGSLRRVLAFMGIYLAVYFVALAVSGLLLPRRIFSAAMPECFDDWCVAAISAAPAPGGDQACPPLPGEKVWVATLKVSNAARGIRQRALDAVALLEDSAGHQYQTCAASLLALDGSRHALSDVLELGGSFQVRQAFSLPAASQPVGLVISHGAFPEVLIIGSDQGFLHARTLLKVDTQVGP